MRGDNDNPDGKGLNFGPAIGALLLPAAVIAVGYLALFLWLYSSDRSAGAIARLCLVVLSLGVPFLIAHAVLRATTIRIQVLPHAILAQPGFPHGRALEVPYSMVRGLTVKRGLAERIAGGGTLVISLPDGASIVVPDLSDAGGAQQAIQQRIAGATHESALEQRKVAKNAYF